MRNTTCILLVAVPVLPAYWEEVVALSAATLAPALAAPAVSAVLQQL